MQATRRLKHFAVAAAALASHSAVLAVNGAQPGGYGIKNAAMGGASIALPLDAEAAANNPAGLGHLPSSWTLGTQVFNGRSSADYVLPGNRLRNRQTEIAPEGGINWRLNSTWAVGLGIAGSGAGSDYGQQALPVPGAGEANTTLRVMELIPAAAWTPSPELSLGLGLNIAVQQFEAGGVIVPTPGGLFPVPGHGKQSASGAGLRAGLLWKPTQHWSVGLNLKSRTRMGKLKGYEQDLLAYSKGRLDIPAQYGIGLAWQPSERLTVAADWLRILWGDIQAMKDPNGFAWRNQPVLRLGAAWQLDERWTLRAGLSRNSRQIDSARAVQNLLVPSINQRAFTLGVSWQLDPKVEINLGYELNPRTTLNGTGASTGTSLTSKVQMVLLGYHHRF
ncbi:OmpP1/FadL family transporter [Paucibacter sp. XJ19-41]|uniref:OmpP1/FadL family transporter n=1 Tax=Paucibacter sp. XJ19-41 TaxID=2927824 RepID=UPI00234A727F|nr:outer membrane protein transport protein [Paucibacter sp. XJ19-41]MDC6166602.1 outer membrane protein transport protein [Paucibacter sp. XJ19-41]